MAFRDLPLDIAEHDLELHGKFESVDKDMKAAVRRCARAAFQDWRRAEKPGECRSSWESCKTLYHNTVDLMWVKEKPLISTLAVQMMYKRIDQWYRGTIYSCQLQLIQECVARGNGLGETTYQTPEWWTCKMAPSQEAVDRALS